MSGIVKVLQVILTLFAKNAVSSPPQASEKKSPLPEVPPRPEPTFKNDSERLKGELNQLKTVNPGLYDLLYDICDYCNREFKKTVVITMIYRTDEEQDEIYKDDEKYKARPFKSPHQYWHALDLRSKTFTPEEIKMVENYLNTKYNGSNYYTWTAKDHIVLNGASHFHIQYSKK